MAVFPTEEWVGALVSLANASPDFDAAGQGWDGTVCLIVRDPPGAPDGPSRIRLAGKDGHWFDFGVRPVAGSSDCRLSLSAAYDMWRQLIRQEVGPLRAILKGDVAVRGHLPDLLKYRASVVILCELAGRLDTEYSDG